MLICIDAGHGKYTSGKRCLKSIDPNETREWTLNSRIANHLQDLLKNYECKTMRVDDPTGETDVPLQTRVKNANNAKADVYVSIHHNAGVQGGTGGGIVVFASNNSSQKSYELQTAVYKATVARTGLRGNRSTPCPLKGFYVIANTKMPSILGEFGFMDSKTDTPIILTDTYSYQVAQGIVDALVSTFNLQEKDEMSYDQFKIYMERYRAELSEQLPTMPGHVQTAVNMGLTDGSRPRDLITREEVMVMAKNAAMYQPN